MCVPTHHKLFEAAQVIDRKSGQNINGKQSFMDLSDSFHNRNTDSMCEVSTDNNCNVDNKYMNVKTENLDGAIIFSDKDGAGFLCEDGVLEEREVEEQPRVQKQRRLTKYDRGM